MSEAWRDGYDRWKLASPWDDEPEDELELDPDRQRDWDRDTEALDAIEADLPTRKGTGSFRGG